MLRTEPNIPELVFQNEVTTGPAGSGDRACIYGAEYIPVQFLRGTVPAAVEAFSIRGSIPDPAAFCAASLKEALLAKGIAVEQGALPAQSKRELFCTTRSPLLKDIVYWTNQKSLNLHPNTCSKRWGKGRHWKGTQVVTEFWRAQGIDLEGFDMADGSGLSRKNGDGEAACRCARQDEKVERISRIFESLPQRGVHVRAKVVICPRSEAIRGMQGTLRSPFLRTSAWILASERK